jgi:hypothetical protein
LKLEPLPAAGTLPIAKPEPNQQQERKKMTNEQIAERLDRFESIGKALEELIIQHSVSLGSIRDSLLESAPLLQLDPELETRIHRNEQKAAARLIAAAEKGDPERAARIKALFSTR